MTHPLLEKVRQHAEAHLDRTIEHLGRYLEIPAISSDPSHAPDVQRLAQRVRDDLEAIGFDRARVCTLDEALPIVAAERLRAGSDKPNLLIYGHLDLQPVKGEAWETPPHEATRKGARLYARGAADDMGGWVSHLAALEAWLAIAGELPLNVKLIIEGEEEIGSPNLERYMDAYPDVFSADVMVLTDCENPSTATPGLTVSLRGLCEVDVTCEALTSDVHSGLWGNMAPDPGNALIKLLSRLLDDDGRLTLGRVRVDPEWQRQAASIVDDETVRTGAHLRSDVAPLPHRGHPPAEWLWRQPALTVLSTTFPRPTDHKNAIRKSVTASLSLRIAPGQTAEELVRELERMLLADPPGGVRVTIQLRPAHSSSWLYRPTGPAFEAANRAYERSWGKPLAHIGIGGSIPFVALFGRRFGDLPLILNGVMDPETGAHGPDESLHLDVFRKAVLANVYLYDELANVRA